MTHKRFSSLRWASRILMALWIAAYGLGPPHAAAQVSETILEDGRYLTMEFREADLMDVLRGMGQEAGLNVILGEEVRGKVTLSFQHVAFDEAFNAILRIHNLISFREGSVVRVVKSPFSNDQLNMSTQIIPVIFANASESSESIKGLLSEKGSVSVNERTNSLIVRDLPDNLNRIREILTRLDSRTPQVMIEARIVEVNKNFTRDLGIQWGGNFTNSTARGTYEFTGAVRDPGTSGTGAVAGVGPLTGGVGLSGENFLVNLPAAVTEGAGGGLGFTFGNVANTRVLDIQLSAMEDTGEGKILSKPRILTLDNKEARISTGTEIFIQTAVLSGTSSGNTGNVSGSNGVGGVTKIDAKLELVVVPHVTPDGQVVMHVRADKKEPDYNRQVQSIPPLTTRTAETDLLVQDGETIVIGGINTRNEGVSVKGIPFLSRIPILGWLFKKEVRVDTESELLIFITPTIYQDGS